ncbi:MULTISPECIES: helicase HerA-like C-terminal domain-containing protein [unclassified Aureimonas]|uniref:helicase HerA-like C-terminal domain-containing protein n=1 Tax=unclassified Aureimonas TaxID=2615206 RepID=UPI000700F7A3|nr:MULTISPECIES: helicase HerA-like C-terminal domain-containing protein [unclassified Aureimonas]KQT66226.1 ATP-binding protein [Aureimonas sp. Leaf427]KQT72415.1 ATP-binding protein [Aureimonas sp. Leaf460]
MLEDGRIFLGASRGPDDTVREGEYLDLKLANRHGLVTGATGTGKTVTLQILAEGFSEAGVPVFCADIKGDLSGIAARGEDKDFLVARAKEIGLDPYYHDVYPVMFWDIFGEKGHPVRATIAEMGPLLLSRLMGLSEAQEGVLNIAFKIADEEGMLLLDLKDLQAMLAHVGENAEEIGRLYGNVAKQTVGAIQRALLVLEGQGAAEFFGEPALKISDLMRTDRDGRGYVNVLAADRLMMNPRLYSTFLLWLMSELFEELPEVGDPEKPKLVFFFDEAHLLFDGAPKVLTDRIEQVVKLIRSKGVGIYFVTQNPLDVPDAVLAQLGNRVQHALRAYTPREQKAVKVAAETFRPNPDFSSFEAITKLGVGEALVSTLAKGGVPSIVQRTLIRPPAGRVGPITDAERSEIRRRSPVAGEYETRIDSESAYEMLVGRTEEKLAREAEREKAEAEGRARARSAESTRRAEAARRRADEAAEEPEPEPERRGEIEIGGFRLPDFGLGRSEEPEAPPAPRRRAPATRAKTSSGYQRQTITETVLKQVGRTAATTVTNAILRGILGSLKRGR